MEEPMFGSQAQVLGMPKMKTWDDYEEGCIFSFAGGHREDGHLDAFRHGMNTVFNLLRSEFPPAEKIRVMEAENKALRKIIEKELVVSEFKDCHSVHWVSRENVYAEGIYFDTPDAAIDAALKAMEEQK